MGLPRRPPPPGTEHSLAVMRNPRKQPADAGKKSRQWRVTGRCAAEFSQQTGDAVSAGSGSEQVRELGDVRYRKQFYVFSQNDIFNGQ